MNSWRLNLLPEEVDRIIDFKGYGNPSGKVWL